MASVTSITLLFSLCVGSTLLSEVQPTPVPSRVTRAFDNIGDVCDNFAVHARTTITFAGPPSMITTGKIGVSPGTAITGQYHLLNDAQLATPAEAMVFAARAKGIHTALMVLPSKKLGVAVELGGQTFEPGVYSAGTSLNIAFGSTVTMQGPGTYIFQAGSTLITAADVSISYTNGAMPHNTNVVFVLGTSATLGARCSLQASILAKAAITFGVGSGLEGGCAVAQTAITFETAGTVDSTENVQIHTQEQ